MSKFTTKYMAPLPPEKKPSSRGEPAPTAVYSAPVPVAEEERARRLAREQVEHDEHSRRERDGILAHLRVEIAFVGEQLRTFVLLKEEGPEIDEWLKRYYCLARSYRETVGVEWGR
jgi:hypothetical protein